MAGMYDEMAPFYDFEYSRKNDDLDFYVDVVKQYGAPVLEIGVGSGRVATVLASQGHIVHGIDNSKQMLDLFREKITHEPYADNLYLYHQDMKTFTIDHTFPCAIIPFRGFAHNLTLEDQIATLDRIHSHLDSDGVLVLDLFVPQFSSLAKSEWNEVINEDEMHDSLKSIKINVSHEPKEQLLHIENVYHPKSPESTSKSARYTFRYIFRYELELLLAYCGFDVLAVLGDFEGNEYSYFSGNMIAIAQKSGA